MEEVRINSPENSQGLSPLREPTFFILLSLATETRHGYAILKDISFLSENRITLSTSTLYTALRRLLEQGLISREESPESAQGGRERKVYRLTDFGRRVLKAEVARLETLMVAARRRAFGEIVRG